MNELQLGRRGCWVILAGITVALGLIGGLAYKMSAHAGHSFLTGPALTWTLICVFGLPVVGLCAAAGRVIQHMVQR